MSKGDLRASELEALDWEPATAVASVEKVKQYVSTKAREAVAWYYAGKRSKRRAAWVFRVGIIVLTAAAGIIPLLNEIHQNRQTHRQLAQAWARTGAAPTVARSVSTTTNAPPGEGAIPLAVLVPRRLLDPVWSAVLVAVAGTLLALDRFHGATSGWVRYVLTAQKLTQALDDFELALELQRLGWKDGKPTPEQTRSALVLARDFLRQTHALVRDETSVWAAEFAAATQQVEERLKAASPARREGSLRVDVANGDQCAGPWRLTVDGGAAEEHAGREATVSVEPGRHTVRVTGKIGDAEVRAEKETTVAGGETAVVELTLA